MGKMSEKEKTVTMALTVFAFLLGLNGILMCGKSVVLGSLAMAFLVFGCLGGMILWSQREKPKETLVSNDAGGS